MVARLYAFAATALMFVTPACAMSPDQQHLPEFQPNSPAGLIMEQQNPKPTALMPSEQTYLAKVIREAISIVKNRAALDDHHPIFGDGKYFFPKDPRTESKLTLSFGPKNFPVKLMSLTFSRVARTSPWNVVQLSNRPDGFPRLVYENNLPSEVLKGFRIEKSYVERTEDDTVNEYHVYEYVETEVPNPVTLRFKSHPQFSDLFEPAPKSFFQLKIESK